MISLFALWACGSENSTTDKAKSPITSSAEETSNNEASIAKLVKELDMERSPGSPGHKTARSLITSTMTKLGYRVEPHPFKHKTGQGGVNLIAFPPKRSASQTWVGAHYDSVSDCPGADDNASGVVGVLEVARRISKAGKPPKDIVFAFWDLEEAGLLGSYDFFNKLSQSEKEAILLYLNLEMIGFHSSKKNSQSLPPGFGLAFSGAAKRAEERQMRGDFVAVIGNASSETSVLALERLAPKNHAIGFTVGSLLIASGLADNLMRSDHRVFWEHDRPAIMITDTAEFRNKHYHCREGVDSTATLNIPFMNRTVNMLISLLSQ